MSSYVFPLNNHRVKNFIDQANEFLEPMSEQDLACALNMREGSQYCGHNPKVLKCQQGDNYVFFQSFDQAGLADARLQCQAGSDLTTEPVGGAGGMIVNPTPDNMLAADIVKRSSRRLITRKHQSSGLNLIIALFVVQLMLLLMNQVI